MGKFTTLTGATAALLALTAPAFAAGTVSATYYTLTSNNPDVENGTGTTSGLIASMLGPDGLPVELTPGTFHDVNSSNELLWWTPNDGPGSVPWVTAGTTYPYPGVVTLPFNITSDYFPNGPAGSDGGSVGFISTELKATFNAPSGGTVTFNLGSDDNSWIFLNGKLVADNGGIHGFTSISFPVTEGLIDGVNSVVVFQADRQTTQSGLSFDADVTLNAIPEPPTWAMMGLGFAGLALAGRRVRRATRAALG